MFEQTKRDIANFGYIWYNLTLLFFLYMGVNSIRADNLSPLVLGIIILNKTEVNIFGQFLRVCGSGLILLIHGHFETFVSVQDLFVKGNKYENCSK